MATVIAVCISEEKGTPKHEVPEIHLKPGHGIIGDAHAGNWHRQVSLLGTESVEPMRAVLPDIPVGAFAENILTEGLTLYTLPGSRSARGPAFPVRPEYTWSAAYSSRGSYHTSDPARRYPSSI